MSAVITPTPRPVWTRLTDALRAAYLRQLIKWHDQDAMLHEWHAEVEPKLAQIARNRAAELRVKLSTLS